MMESSNGNKNWRYSNHLTSSRATLLWDRLQDLSEREHRSRNRNQKLLQDFQRAQNTLSDLVARTEAMNTMRMVYARILEENCSKIQQKRLSDRKTMRKQHQEKGDDPDPTLCATFNSLSHTSDHREGAESLPTKHQRSRNNRTKETKTNNTRKDAAPDWSSSLSASQNHKKKRHEQPNGSKTAFKTSKGAVDSPNQLVKQNKGGSNHFLGTLTSSDCIIKNKYKDEEEKVMRKGVNKESTRESTGNQDAQASLCEEHNREERSRKQRKAVEEKEPLRSKTYFNKSVLEEDSVKESEADEEKEEEEESTGEDTKSRASEKVGNDESEREENNSDVTVSGSERSIQDSHRELHEDDAEDDLAEKDGNINAKDDGDDDDSEDDDVIIGKFSPWTCHPVVEDSECQNDDDDIEGLLAPQK